MSKYQLFPEAEIDLDDIWLYTATNWGAEQAIRYTNSLIDSMEVLADSPLICRERSEFSPPVRIHHTQHHLIIYTQAEQGIAVIRILHENMDYESLLNEGSA